MTIAEVTVQYINPRKGTLPASIKDTEGAYYTVSDEMLSQFQEKRSYKIEYDLEEARNGKAYKVIKRAKPSEAAHQQLSGIGYGRGLNPSQDPHLAERIFVCGLMNATMSNPNVQPHELEGEAVVRLVEKYRKVFAMTFGKAVAKAEPSARDDMGGDEIPW